MMAATLVAYTDRPNSLFMRCQCRHVTVPLQIRLCVGRLRPSSHGQACAHKHGHCRRQRLTGRSQQTVTQIAAAATLLQSTPHHHHHDQQHQQHRVHRSGHRSAHTTPPHLKKCLDRKPADCLGVRVRSGESKSMCTMPKRCV